jgi:KUP system potassium uptake protein
MQKRGTAGVGALFGPVMLVWFVSIALFGIVGIIKNPYVLSAVNPLHAIRFFAHHKLHGFLALGAVVLCVTGGEALYADMGHFGQRSIRLAWYTLVFPALLLNYFGQGAYLLAHGKGEGTFNPFFQIVPSFGAGADGGGGDLGDDCGVAGADLGRLFADSAGGAARLLAARRHRPHLRGCRGPDLRPEINWMMMVGCLALVLAFRKEGSTGLAAAYGIAVTGTMAITSILFGVVAASAGAGASPKIVSLVGLFLVIDLSFFGANVAKIADGGWIPLVVAVGIFTVMTTWKAGARRPRAVRPERQPADGSVPRRLAGAQPAPRQGHRRLHDRQPRRRSRSCCSITSSTTKCCTSRSSCCRS